ncbi:MAG: hypothetical protein HY340_01210 [Candidatus Kerfeldbacteria bacterium]|nr:hypothetical protein [Candidatus Kerfeldbacteria bacterium]
MQRRLLGLLLVIGIVGGVVIGMAARFPKQTSLASSIERGMTFLASSYRDYRYDDEYLNYVYPGEALTCPVEGCKLTYRVLDAFFNVMQLRNERLNRAGLLGLQVGAAETSLQAILPEWRQANLYNTIKGSGTGGVALDTACILGYATNDKDLAEHIVTFLTDDDNLLADDEYTTDTWRNIADETWCVRLFAKTSVAPETVKPMTARKVQETTAYLANATPVEKVAVLYHMAFLLREAGDVSSTTRLEEYLEELSKLADDPTLIADTFTQANILDALARNGFSGRARLDELAKRLWERQQSDGSWAAAVGSGRYPVFTTFRAVTALTAHEKLVKAQP